MTDARLIERWSPVATPGTNPGAQVSCSHWPVAARRSLFAGGTQAFPGNGGALQATRVRKERPGPPEPEAGRKNHSSFNMLWVRDCGHAHCPREGASATGGAALG